MRCLILGGTGLIGCHTAAEFSRQGCEVRVLARSPGVRTVLPPAVESVWTDWNLTDMLDRTLCGTDVVIHLISSIRPGKPGVKGAVRPETALERDLAVNGRFLRLCLERGVRRLVFLSSGGTVYGPARFLPIPETHPTSPINSYGRAKLALERQISSFCLERGLDFVILRGANAYGEYHDPSRAQGAVNVFLRQVAAGLPLEIWGGLGTVRDYLYAGDMAKALYLAAISRISGQVLNLGSGQGTSLAELVAMIRRVTGRAVPLTFGEGRKDDVPGNVLDIRKIREVLDWTPETDLARGIDRTWGWVRSVCG